MSCKTPTWVIEAFYEEGWLADPKAPLGTVEFTREGAALAEQLVRWVEDGLLCGAQVSESNPLRGVSNVSEEERDAS